MKPARWMLLLLPLLMAAFSACAPQGSLPPRTPRPTSSAEESSLSSVRGLEFTTTGDGLDVTTMPGSGVGQGHQDQFIAELAQWGMPLDRKFRVGAKDYTFADFVRHSKARARIGGGQELSWTILILGQYFGTDIEWTNSAGEKLKYADLLRYELEQPMDNAACGGTHRLFDLTWVYHLHRAKGGQKVGIWKEVADKLAYYKELAHKHQNPDGSFSSKYVVEKGFSDNSEIRIATTGHVLEWLSLMLSDRELTAPWMQEAVNVLTRTILEHRSDPIDGGALYHAVHGLRIYRQRVFGKVSPGLMIPLPPREENGSPPANMEDAKSLDKRIEAALNNVGQRDLLTTHAFWTIFHGILGMGPDVTLLDPATGKRVNALDHICNSMAVK
jgi:hypothetical protein